LRFIHISYLRGYKDPAFCGARLGRPPVATVRGTRATAKRNIDQIKAADRHRLKSVRRFKTRDSAMSSKDHSSREL
jgi:hypothetical protein